MSEKRDYYEILEVSRTADGETIKKSFRSLALKYHPDRNPGDTEAEERFKDINEAYGVLSDPGKKQLYDQYGHDGLKGQNGFHSGGFGDFFSGFGDIFRDFFGGGSDAYAYGPRRGQDLAYELDIEFEEAYSGVEKVISIPREENCENCNGTGALSDKKETCPQCRGEGQIFQGHGFIRMASTCPRCRGKRVIYLDPCPECQGLGRVKKIKEVTVKVPAGVDTGHRLRYQGRGDLGIRGGSNGDLFIEICVKRHAIFYREGVQVVLEKKIDMTLAALGGELEIPTVTGETRTVTVPAGTQNGRLLRVDGLGFPHLKNPTRKRGDLIVSLNVLIPKDLTEKQIGLLKEFARLEEEKKNETLFQGIKRKVGEKLKNVLK
ncbi:MAG: molecular chaperone DnaJ [Deltaproteobacteria bacterium]|jgi:molecular chaperone DnaJ|nr:molecular chaperone DnaJ [Deltaproteobacteria bacterium]